MPRVADNVIAGNSAEIGGGLRFCFFGGVLPEPEVTHNLIVGNTAGMHGGGLCCEDAGPVVEFTTIENNQAGERGGGVYGYNGSHPVLRNSIVSNSSQGGGIYVESGADVTTEYCDVWNNTDGDYVGCSPSPSDISCDPEFCDAYALDMRFFETSGCEGAGAGGVDMGARGVGCFTVDDVVFYDNFSDQDTAGWSAASYGAANMMICFGKYQGGAQAPGAWARGVVDPQPTVWTDYRYRVKMMLLEPWSSGSWARILFRYRDEQNFYLTQFDGEVGQLWKQDNSGGTMLLEFPYDLSADDWTVLSFLLDGRRIHGNVEPEGGAPEPLFSYEDVADPILDGSVGVGVFGESAPMTYVWYDDVMVASTDTAVSVAPGTQGPAPHPGEGAFWTLAAPNPFNCQATIEYSLAAPGRLLVQVYDLRGRWLCTLCDDHVSDGRGSLTWSGTNDRGETQASGVYCFVATALGTRTTGKLVLAK